MTAGTRPRRRLRKLKTNVHTKKSRHQNCPEQSSRLASAWSLPCAANHWGPSGYISSKSFLLSSVSKKLPEVGALGVELFLSNIARVGGDYGPLPLGNIRRGIVGVAHGAIPVICNPVAYRINMHSAIAERHSQSDGYNRECPAS